MMKTKGEAALADAIEQAETIARAAMAKAPGEDGVHVEEMFTHCMWQSLLDGVILGGVAPGAAAESMLIVATAGMVDAEGPRRTGQHLAILAGMLARVADERDASTKH